MNWINVAEDKDKGRLLVNTVMDIFLTYVVMHGCGT